LNETYLQYRLSWSELLNQPEIKLLGLTVLLMSLPWVGVIRRPVAACGLLIAAGFFLAYLIEAKGYFNHKIAFTSMAIFAVTPSFLTLSAERVRLAGLSPIQRGAPLVAGVWLAIYLVWLGAQYQRPLVYRSLGLEQDISKLADAKSILAISKDLDVGHPLARRVKLDWARSVCSDWLFSTAGFRALGPYASPQLKATMRLLMQEDMSRLSDDMARNRPDVVLLDLQFMTPEQLQRDYPATYALLANYRLATRKADIDLYVRKADPADAPAAPLPSSSRL
jgi:hypothetical protein